jgi:ATP-dependent DNA helicase RecG
MAAKLAALGIAHDLDLVLHLPLRYEDETRVTPISAPRQASPVQIQARVERVEIAFRPRRQLIVRVRDESGEALLRFLNFQGSQQKALEAARDDAAQVRAFGELRSGFFGGEMIHPRYRILRGEAPLPTTLTPVYPTTAGLAQHALRRLLEQVLSRVALDDTLPEAVLRRFRLLPFRDAVMALHHPGRDDDLEALVRRTHPAWARVKFDELLAQQLSMRKHYRERKARAAAPMVASGALVAGLLERLSFRLTRAQQRAWSEIERDLRAAHPMHRLLQGDVGSGKTVVAALAALRAAENSRQTAVMAPTEILAEQHLRKFSEWLSPSGLRVVWLSGSQTKKERAAAMAEISSGSAIVVVGTHALFQEGVAFRSLGLAIVDEQHRFGVAQRLALRDKARPRGVQTHAPEPHVLMMSATPIPRTLSMSYYADLDVSLIDELPPGRRPVVTKLVSAARRREVLSRVREACASGQQAYWVCPLIEDSPTLELRTVLETHATLREELPELQAGLLHGRMTAAEKTAVMEDFAAQRLKLLVATTVIEVGVDVPNASLMVIEHAERFGLAQLHQLRGRIGRGAAESVCVLLYEGPLSEGARRRLKVVYENTDGFVIAREDLQLRGPGEYLGARQSGVPLLRFADLTQDEHLLEQVQAAAELLLEQHPGAAEQHLQRWLGARADFLMA